MVEYTFNFLGVEEITKFINRFFATFIDTKKMQQGALDAFFKVEEKMFATQGGANPWKDLTSKYREWKQKNYGSLPLMQLTGLLKKGLTGKDKSNLKVEQKDEILDIILYSDYWHNHQYGTSIPQRKTVDFTDEDKDFIVQSMLLATIGGRFAKFFTKD